MEVRLDKRFELDCPAEAAWAVLSDVRAVGGCMPGAQVTTQIDENRYAGTLRTRIGPASMQFAGEIEVLSRDDSRRALGLRGKGADRGGSAASMTLEAAIEDGAAPGTSVLAGQACADVSGKLAQFGSRLLVPVADAMLEQFAEQFKAAAAARAAAEASPVQAWQASQAPHAPHSPHASNGSPVEPPALPAQPQAAETALAAAEAPATAAVPPAPAATPTAAASVQAPTPAPVRELHLLPLLWSAFKRWLAARMGRQ